MNTGMHECQVRSEAGGAMRFQLSYIQRHLEFLIALPIRYRLSDAAEIIAAPADDFGPRRQSPLPERGRLSEEPTSPNRSSGRSRPAGCAIRPGTPRGFALSCRSRADVDEIVQSAVRAGGAHAMGQQDHGFM
jgi:hypothetical protein